MRLQATHFVEVYSSPGGVSMTNVLLISQKEKALAFSIKLGFETIAIFKIKMK